MPSSWAAAKAKKAGDDIPNTKKVLSLELQLNCNEAEQALRRLEARLQACAQQAQGAVALSGLQAEYAQLEQAALAAANTVESAASKATATIQTLLTQLTRLYRSLWSLAAQESQAATEAAEEGAEQTAKSFADFDEIQQLHGSTAETVASAQAAEESQAVAEKAEAALESWGEALDGFLEQLLETAIPSLQASLSSLADWLNELAAKLYEALRFPGVYEKICQLGAELAEAFNDFINALDWATIGAAIGAAMNDLIGFLQALIWGIDWQGLGAKLAEAVNSMFAEIDWYKAGQLLWAGFKIAMETLAGLINNLDMEGLALSLSEMLIGFFASVQETFDAIDWTKMGQQITEFFTSIQWEEIADTLAGALNSIIQAVQDFDFGTALASLLNGIFALLLELTRSFDWANLGSTIAQAINHLFLGFDWTQAATALAELVNGLVLALYTLLMETDWQDIGTAIAQGLIALITGFDWLSAFACTLAIAQALFEALWGCIQTLGSWLLEMGGYLVEGLLSGIQAGMCNISSWLANNVATPILSAIQSLFGIHSPSTVFAELGGYMMAGLVNGIADGKDSVVAAFDDLLDSMQGTANIGLAAEALQLPALASGAVIPPNRQFAAILGDDTTEEEVVSPLSTIEQALENVLNRTGLGTGGDMSISLNIDGAEFARVIYPYSEAESTRRGSSLIAKAV